MAVFLEEAIPLYFSCSSRVNHSLFFFPRKNEGNPGLLYVSASYSTGISIPSAFG